MALTDPQYGPATYQKQARPARLAGAPPFHARGPERLRAKVNIAKLAHSGRAIRRSSAYRIFSFFTSATLLRRGHPDPGRTGLCGTLLVHRERPRRGFRVIEMSGQCKSFSGQAPPGQTRELPTS